MWYRVLERFGLPTLFAVALLGYEFTRAKWDRQERTDLLGGIKAAITEQTKAQVQAAAALHELAQEERSHADAVRLTWPRVREPPRRPRPATEEEPTP